jgi:hypothetical protein
MTCSGYLPDARIAPAIGQVLPTDGDDAASIPYGRVTAPWIFAAAKLLHAAEVEYCWCDIKRHLQRQTD